MTYFHLAEWIAQEDPEFVAAIRSHYSIRDGRRDAASLGEIAYWHTAERLLEFAPADTRQWTPEQNKLLWPLMALVNARFRDVRIAVRTLDYRYLRKLADGVQTQKTGRQKEGSMEDIEYIFEAYLFLRNRDGEGSPKPLKDELKSYAALIRAFDIRNLMDKLPKYIWDPYRSTPMPGVALTDRELAEVTLLQKKYIEDRPARAWTDLLKNAGLPGLQQRRRSSKK